MKIVRTPLLFVTALLLACAQRSDQSSPSNQTPVILISVDTLRSDHLPAYGYRGVETPNLDALRADGILYEHAYSHVPLTLPSHVSILTGMLPTANGVRDNLGFRVADSTPMIQEVLAANGYATGAAVSSYVLRHETRLDRGFDLYDDAVAPLGGPTAMGQVQRDGRETIGASLRWIDGAARKPFFLFLHLYEPHTPYAPPEPFLSRAKNRYDGEIAYVDDLLGRFFAELKTRGVYDRALIVLLSDHGEGLNDHGEEEHGFFVYREAIQVPLLVKLPRSQHAGVRVPAPVQLVDVFPTIAEQTASSVAADRRRTGTSLLSFLDPNAPVRPVYSESYYARFHYGWHEVQSLVDGVNHYIRAPRPELYDLSSDAHESANRLTEDRRTYAKLRAALEPMLQEPAAPSAVSAEEAAKLAALGYVGSAAAGKSGAALPDVKDMLGTYRDIRLAFTFFDGNNPAEAVKLADRLLRENAQITDLWGLKSKALYQLGRRREALEAAQEGLRHVPGAVSLLFDAATVAMAIGDLKTAEEHASIGASIEPGRGNEMLARIALLSRKNDLAERHAKEALRYVQNPTKVLMLLGAIEMDRGRWEKALEWFGRVEVTRARIAGEPVANLHRNRGEALARLGRNAEAERELRAAIEDRPGDASAYSALVMLLVSQKRDQEATRLVFDAVRASPKPATYIEIAQTLEAVGDRSGAQYWAVEGLRRYPEDSELRQLARPTAR